MTPKPSAESGSPPKRRSAPTTSTGACPTTGEKRYGLNADGTRRKHYYVKESVGIAAGIFVAALHNMGLGTLTHTPSPMAFLTKLLDRPSNERPFILFPIGYPEPGSVVPKLERKPLDGILVEYHDRATEDTGT